jgi:hypothetical protein
MAKKLLFPIILAAVVFALAAKTDAIFFTEEYIPVNSPPNAADPTTAQFAGPSDTFIMAFDFWFTNDVRGVTNTSNLLLSQDAEDGFGTYTSATLDIELFSTDDEAESAQVILLFLVNGSLALSDLGVFIFNATALSPFFTISHNFSAAQLDAFDNNGLTGVFIGAPNVSSNDFGVTKVSVTLNAIPEPGTVALLALGLAALALAVYRRKTPDCFDSMPNSALR